MQAFLREFKRYNAKHYSDTCIYTILISADYASNLHFLFVTTGCLAGDPGKKTIEIGDVVEHVMIEA